jgi:uncharacterized membrane protein YhaH (DUF805 family)
MTQAVNPYDAPKAAVVEAAGGTQPVKVFSISGRIGRARYIVYGIGFYFLASVIGGLAIAAVGDAGAAVLVLAWAAALVMGFMLTIQRCHDCDASGWLSLVLLIPLVNLTFWFIPGSSGANRYGPPTPSNSAGMIVAACVLPFFFFFGIFGVVGMQGHSDRSLRTRVAEALAVARPWQAAIDEHYAATRRLPAGPPDLGDATVSLRRDYNTSVGDISLDANGVLTFTFAKDAGMLDGETIVLRPSVSGAGLAWDCKGGTVGRRYRPARCR